ncbi:MAG: helix-turn-helix domain-containing protein [Oscillospiraceae bacterium]
MFLIDRMGCGSRHDGDFVFDRSMGYDGYLVLFVKTKAIFVINGQQIETEPETFIIYDKHTPQWYRACEECYINDWIQFSCTEQLSSEIPIVFDTPLYIGQNINVSQYFQLIADCYYRTNNSQAAGHLIQAMLSDVFSRPSHAHFSVAHYRELLDLRRKIYAQPTDDWSVDKMAAMMNVSTPYLHMLYKQAFGTTCTADVIQSRIEQAQRYLAYTNMTVEEIAFKSGYKSAVHFSRQFKSVTGCSPIQWRKAQC